MTEEKKSDPIHRITIGEDRIALRKSFDGWRVVYPLKNEDGSWNMQNVMWLGPPLRFFKALIICLLILGLFTFVYMHDTALARETVQNHINIFANLSNITKNVEPTYSPLNLSNLQVIPINDSG